MARNNWTSPAFIQPSLHNAWNPHHAAFGIPTAYNRPRPAISYNPNATSRHAFAATQPRIQPRRSMTSPQAMFGTVARSPSIHFPSSGALSSQKPFQRVTPAVAPVPPPRPRPELKIGGQAWGARDLD